MNDVTVPRQYDIFMFIWPLVCKSHSRNRVGHPLLQVPSHLSEIDVSLRDTWNHQLLSPPDLGRLLTGCSLFAASICNNLALVHGPGASGVGLQFRDVVLARACERANLRKLGALQRLERSNKRHAEG
jgi:hypothetical protein